MVRELQVNVAKNIPATHIADVEMVTGMGAQINLTADAHAILPAAVSSENIYMVEREREVTGMKASLTDIDDYDIDFVTVKADTPVKLIPMYSGERYGTDQYKDADIVDSNIGKPLAVGTDGKWMLATSESRYVLAGTMQDGTHKLAVIRVMDTPVATA